MQRPARKSGSRTSATLRRHGASRIRPGPNGIPPQLVFGTGDGSSLLISLNAKTGEFNQAFGQGGKVNLRAGRRREVSEAAGRIVVAAGDLRESCDHGQSLAGSTEPRALGRRACVGYCARAGSCGPFTRFRRPGEPNHDAWKNNQWVDRAGANAWGFITVDYGARDCLRADRHARH